MEHEPRRSRPGSARPEWRSFASSKTYNPDWGAMTTFAVIFWSIGAVLVVAALVFAFAIDPPALAWIWFAIVSIIVLGLALWRLLRSNARASAHNEPPSPSTESRGFS